MATYLFQDILKRGKTAGVDGMTPTQAIEWYRNAAQAITRADPNKMLQSAENFENVPKLSINSIGKLYMWQYDAKHKATLPYWDKYPMDFILNVYPEKRAFLGLNMHYLPPFARAKLMDALYPLINNTKMDKTTKLRLSYQILNNSSQFNYFKPCVKMYLVEHVKSSFLYMKPPRWDVAVLLPLARFQKANQTTVWAESMVKATK